MLRKHFFQFFSSVIVVLSLCCTYGVKGTQCYNCSTELTQNCGEPFDPNGQGVKEINCPANVPCQKVKLPTIGGGDEPILRGCYDEDFCTELSVCYSCDRDLCNSSTTFLPSFIVTVISIMSVLYIYF